MNINKTKQNKFQDASFQNSHCGNALTSFHLLVNLEVHSVTLFTNDVVQEKKTEAPVGVNGINQFTAEADQVLTRLSGAE